MPTIGEKSDESNMQKRCKYLLSACLQSDLNDESEEKFSEAQ